MARAAQNPAQNNEETREQHPGQANIGPHRFQPGQSGNPSGRPKGIARLVREKAGGSGELLVDLLFTALAGWLPVGGHEPVDEAGRVKLERVSEQGRLRAAEILIERGWGKAPAFAPIEDDDPLDLAERNDAEMAATLNARLDELAARRAERKPAAKPSKPRTRKSA